MYREFEDNFTVGVTINSFSPLFAISGVGCPSMVRELKSKLVVPGVVNINELKTPTPVLPYSTGVRVYPSFGLAALAAVGIKHSNIDAVKQKEMIFFIEYPDLSYNNLFF